MKLPTNLTPAKLDRTACTGDGHDGQDELQLHDRKRFVEDDAVSNSKVSPCCRSMLSSPCRQSILLHLPMLSVNYVRQSCQSIPSVKAVCHCEISICRQSLLSVHAVGPSYPTGQLQGSVMWRLGNGFGGPAWFLFVL